MHIDWRTRDISRPLTSLVVLVSLMVVFALTYYRGWYGLLASLAYLAGIAFLLAIYLTAWRQWGRLFRYLSRTLKDY